MAFRAGALIRVSIQVTMLSGYHPVLQSLMGTLLTWGLTAIGAGLVLVFQGGQVSIYSAVRYYW